MRALVTGAGGMLGSDLCDVLRAGGHEVVATGRAPGLTPLDVTDTDQTRSVIAGARPDVVFHCAAWTDVDGAERDPEGAWRGNALGAWNVAAAVAATDAALMIHVSTDFVFDGAKTTPYTEFDAVRPLGAYGVTKEAGERLVRQTLPARHIIARTSWLFGLHGKNFVTTIRRLASTRPEVPVVADQVGVPTLTSDLARKLVELALDPLPGTYHVCNGGEPCSWYDFARTIAAKSGLTADIVPITAAEYAARFNSPTQRPAYSPMRRLCLELRGLDDMPAWNDALNRYLEILEKI